MKPSKEGIMMSYLFLDPTDGPKDSGEVLAPRLTELDGKVLGVIDNSKQNADFILQYVTEKLQSKYTFKNIIYKKKSSLSQALSDEEVEALAKECDVILAGVGD
jgi:hypothetical protein